MKKLFAILLSATMVLSLAACGGSEEAPAETTTPGSTESTETTDPAEQLKFCMVLDAGGLGDGGFNDLAWEGMQWAVEEFDATADVVEPSEAAQYANSIESSAQQGYDIIVCVGFNLEDALQRIAPIYPDTQFVIVDGTVEADNVYCYNYQLQEASFLAGVLAGYVQEDSDTFGVVVGMEIPSTISWGSGFISGVKAVNPDATILTSAVGTFVDPGTAKELALAQFNQGASTVMEVSSGGAIGVIEAAADSGNTFIATDSSKDSYAPGSEFTAALAGRDGAVYAAICDILDGSAVPGNTLLSMADDVFSLPENTEDRYGADAVAIVEQAKQMVIDGDIVVPSTYEEAQAFGAVDFG